MEIVESIICPFPHNINLLPISHITLSTNKLRSDTFILNPLFPFTATGVWLGAQRGGAKGFYTGDASS